MPCCRLRSSSSRVTSRRAPQPARRSRRLRRRCGCPHTRGSRAWTPSNHAQGRSRSAHDVDPPAKYLGGLSSPTRTRPAAPTRTRRRPRCDCPCARAGADSADHATPGIPDKRKWTRTTLTGTGVNHPKRLIKAALRELDVKLSRYDWRSTELLRGDTPEAKRSSFRPPRGPVPRQALGEHRGGVLRCDGRHAQRVEAQHGGSPAATSSPVASRT